MLVLQEKYILGEWNNYPLFLESAYEKIVFSIGEDNLSAVIKQIRLKTNQLILVNLIFVNFFNPGLPSEIKKTGILVDSILGRPIIDELTVP